SPHGGDVSYVLLKGYRNFEMVHRGGSEDEGLSTGKVASGYWTGLFAGFSVKSWKKCIRKRISWRYKDYLRDAMISLRSALGTFGRKNYNPEKLPPSAEPRPALVHPGQESISEGNDEGVLAVPRPFNFLFVFEWRRLLDIRVSQTLAGIRLRAVPRSGTQDGRLFGLEVRTGISSKATANLSEKVIVL
ncbi:unnamed protein product, partial [Symbiodinium microadriaticum]